jgi:uncharacterized protein (TIGR03437 family)
MLRWVTCLLLLFRAVSQAQTGTPVPALAPFDQLMTTLLSTYNIPGGSIAVTKDGRLLLARGYGFADQQNQVPVQPDSLFRIASLSKLITSVTVMHLVEQGKLTLDQPAFALLPDLQPPAGASVDARLKIITIRHLLTHTGGWDDSIAPDPMFYSPQIVKALGCPAPASTENIIRYMMGQPLQFNPGARYAYSNFGYAVLGRIIERVTGMSYEQYVRLNVLAPMGISRMRIGQTLPRGRLPDEVNYYSAGNTPSIFPDYPGSVPWGYGGWYMEAMDSHGGWLASAVDYAKFVNAIDGRRGTRFLSPASVAAMTARPSASDWIGASAWYGFGLMVRPAGSDANWWHSGALDGTATYQVRTSDGYSWVVFLNYRPGTAKAQDSLYNDIDAGLWNAISKVSTVPSGDRFSSYPDTGAAAASTPALDGREGVVNGATFDRGVVSGSWITLRGANLSGTARIWRGDDIVGGKLPASLDGVSVKINGQPAYLYYISPTQINVQAPEGLTPGWVTAEVIRNGVSSGAVLTHAVQSAPGPFLYSAGNRTFVVATAADNITVIGDPAAAPGTRTAAPGDTIVIYGTGLGPSPAGIAAPVEPPLSGVTVTIAGQPARVTFAGLRSPGLYQINAVVPQVPNGDQLLVVGTGAAQSPALGVIPVRR